MDALFDIDSIISDFSGDRFDMILTDIMMPKVDGFQLCREIRDLNMNLFILAMTSSDDESVLRRIICAGADDFIQKPNLMQKKEAEMFKIRLLVAENIIRRRMK